MNPISRSSEYAIRALTYLAQQASEPGYVLARDMAERLGIPAPFLGKLLQPLVGAGMLESQRGRGGGFRLAQRADRIDLLRIVDTLETSGSRRACFLGQAECSDERACPLHTYWKAAKEDFEQQLTRTTLADLLAFCEERPHSGYPLPLPRTTRGRAKPTPRRAP